MIVSAADHNVPGIDQSTTTPPRFRELGSASLEIAYVAAGRLDAFIQWIGLSLWDVAAAGLIAERSGAVVTSVDGGSWFDLAFPPRSLNIIAASPAFARLSAPACRRQQLSIGHVQAQFAGSAATPDPGTATLAPRHPNRCHLSRAPESPGSLTARQPIGVPHAATVPQPGAIGVEDVRNRHDPRDPSRPVHRCQVDDLAYASLSDWFRDHCGHVPIQAAAGLDRYIKATGSTFAEAFAALSGKRGPIILIEEEEA